MGIYNNGKPMEVPENEEEKALAISEWAEENEHLQNAISSCIDNGIQTFASCKGHKIIDSPYLSMVITNKNIDKITNIINNISKKKGTDILLTFDEKNKGSILTIYSNMLNRDNIFDLIAKSANSSIELDNANNITKQIIRLHETLRIHGVKSERMRSDILLYNGILDRKINVQHSNELYSFGLDETLQTFKFRKRKDYFGKYNYILKSRNLEKKLEVFNDNLIANFVYALMVEDDEFYYKITHEPERRNIKATTIGENADKILENTFDDKDLSNNIIKTINNLDKKLRFSGLDLNKISKEYSFKSNLKTKLNKKQSLEIVDNFFKEFGIDVSKLLQESQMKNKNNQTIILTMNPEVKRNEASAPLYNSDDILVNVIETGTLTDAYSLVHEISHTLNPNFNEATLILGEVIPQCMEKMFDDYLKDLPAEQKGKYGFDENVLNEDIRKRNISTTLNRFNISKNVVKYDGPEKSECSRYMLAEIYSYLLFTFSKDKRKEKINEFISALKNNNIGKANQIFDVKISKENTSCRDAYVKTCVYNLQELLKRDENGSFDGEDKSILIDKEINDKGQLLTNFNDSITKIGR